MYAKKIQQISFTKIEIKIAKHLFKHYKKKYNARQLAKALDINHAHTNNLCNLLLQKELLLKEDLGNSAYFTFNYRNQYAIKLIAYLLSLEKKEFPDWMAVPLYELEEFIPHIQLGLVFGSSIKRKNFNDIDVLLVYDKKNTQKIQDIKKSIIKSQLVDQPIRYVEITDQDIERNKDKPVFYSMLSESLVFYNPDNYIDAVERCCG